VFGLAEAVHPAALTELEHAIPWPGTCGGCRKSASACRNLGRARLLRRPQAADGSPGPSHIILMDAPARMEGCQRGSQPPRGVAKALELGRVIYPCSHGIQPFELTRGNRLMNRCQDLQSQPRYIYTWQVL
jgi:hypothetical protein